MKMVYSRQVLVHYCDESQACCSVKPAPTLVLPPGFMASVRGNILMLGKTHNTGRKFTGAFEHTWSCVPTGEQLHIPVLLVTSEDVKIHCSCS